MNAPDRPPSVPQAVEAEQAVIGALLIDNAAFDRIGDLRPEHFYRHDHRTIFGAIAGLILADRPADMFTAFEYLASQGKADACGGMAYLNSLCGSSPGSSNITRYAEMVLDRWQKRRLSSVGAQLQDMALNPHGATAAELLDKAQGSLEAIAVAEDAGAMVDLQTAMSGYVELIDQQYHGSISATSTGFPDLDAKLSGGLNAGDLVIIAGRPSMGKTAFALGIGRHIADAEPVAIFSMEMPTAQLMRRFVSLIGGIPMQVLGDPKRMLDQHWPLLTHAVGISNQLQMFVDDRPARTLHEIRARCRAIKRKHGLGLVIVDYLQLMAGGEGDNRTQQVGANSRGLKSLAKELDVPILLLAQLNRDLEKRADKRPMMADLRDSGEIEQDADILLFLYRDEVYNPDSMDRGIAEVIVGKQRNGETGRVALGYQGEFTRFVSLSPGTEFGRRPERSKRQKGFSE